MHVYYTYSNIQQQRENRKATKKANKSNKNLQEFLKTEETSKEGEDTETDAQITCPLNELAIKDKGEEGMDDSSQRDLATGEPVRVLAYTHCQRDSFSAPPADSPHVPTLPASHNSVPIVNSHYGLGVSYLNETTSTTSPDSVPSHCSPASCAQHNSPSAIKCTQPDPPPVTSPHKPTPFTEPQNTLYTMTSQSPTATVSQCDPALTIGDSVVSGYASSGPQGDGDIATSGRQGLGNRDSPQDDRDITTSGHQGNEDITTSGDGDMIQEQNTLAENEGHVDSNITVTAEDGAGGEGMKYHLEACLEEVKCKADSILCSLQKFCAPESLTGDNQFACAVCTSTLAKKTMACGRKEELLPSHGHGKTASRSTGNYVVTPAQTSVNGDTLSDSSNEDVSSDEGVAVFQEEHCPEESEGTIL